MLQLFILYYIMQQRRFALVILVLTISCAFPVTIYSCRVKPWNPFLGRSHVAALILARGGSKGIPLKNLALVGGTSLIERSLNAVTATDAFQSIWVSTDNDVIAAKVLKVFGNAVNIHWRSEDSATDEATSIFATQEFLNNHPDIDFVALVQCTSPFINRDYLIEANELMRLGSGNGGSRCVFSVTRSFKLRWAKTASGSLIPLNFDPTNRPRRQDWPGELIENGMFYFAARSLIQQGFLQSEGCAVVIIPEEYSIEIDSEWDLKVANVLHERA